MQLSTTVSGCKFQVMQDGLRPSDLSSFTWVWAVDADFNIKHTDVKRALQLTEESGALISIPAFTQVGSDEDERKLEAEGMATELDQKKESRGHRGGDEGVGRLLRAAS